MPQQDLAKAIDHTLLKPGCTEAEIRTTCEEAVRYGFATVCVEKRWLPTVTALLGSSSVKPIAVIAFPTGKGTAAAKAAEAAEAVVLGAKEIDMVIDRDAIAARDWTKVFAEVRAVVDAAGTIPVKVILETAELTAPEIAGASAISAAAGCAFVKTSTGFGKGGASVEAVRLMREVVGKRCGVKASGGVRSFADAVAMIEAGANRLGTSASVAIIQGGESKGTY